MTRLLYRRRGNAKISVAGSHFEVQLAAAAPLCHRRLQPLVVCESAARVPALDMRAGSFVERVARVLGCEWGAKPILFGSARSIGAL